MLVMLILYLWGKKRFMQKKPTLYEAPTSGQLKQGQNEQIVEAKRKFRLLICSPSNGGCDELTRRLKVLRKDRTSALQNLTIVRVGRNENIHTDCDDVGFDAMVKAKIDELICKKQLEKTSSLKDHYNTLLSTERNLKKKIEILKTSSSAKIADASSIATFIVSLLLFLLY